MPDPPQGTFQQSHSGRGRTSRSTHVHAVQMTPAVGLIVGAVPIAAGVGVARFSTLRLD